MAISRKRRKFIEEYLRCWNAAEAARRAGYSERTARSIGHEILTIPDIKEEIQKRLDEAAMSADEVLTRLAEQARGDWSQYIRFDGGVLLFDWAAAIRDRKVHLVKRVYFNEVGAPMPEFYDAQSALVQLGRHHALFTDKQALDISGVKAYVGVSPDDWDDGSEADT